MGFLTSLIRFIGKVLEEPARPATAAPARTRQPPQPAAPARTRQPPQPAAPHTLSMTPAMLLQDPLFWGRRSPLSKRVITEQVVEISSHIFTDGVDFDEDNAHWVVIPQYHLPHSWKGVARTTELMIVFPTEYPEIPPIGFYLKGDIPIAPGGHFFAQAYHNAAKAPLEQDWKWYCVYVNPGSWRPAAYRRPMDWKRGDNLFTYLTLIKEALSATHE